MEFLTPNPAQLHAGLRAMKTVAEVDAPLNLQELALLEAIARAFGGAGAGGVEELAGPIAELPSIEPAELAERISDPQLRWQLTGGLVVMTLADGDLEQSESTIVSRFAAGLGVEDPAIRNLERVAKGWRQLARFDILRRQWAPRKIKAVAAEKGAGVYWAAIRGLMRNYIDEEVSARYRALADKPAGSLGRAYADYVEHNDFSVPGERGSPPEVIVFHDMTHILSGYDTSPSEEILVAAFSAGYSEAEPFNWLMFVLLQFQLGIQTAPGVEPEFDMLNPARLLEAISRGAAMNLDLNVGWDYWSVIDEDVETLRARYGIQPEKTPDLA